jgi:ribosomal protein S1
VGDIIDLEILKIEPERGRISLGWAACRDREVSSRASGDLSRASGIKKQ